MKAIIWIGYCGFPAILALLTASSAIRAQELSLVAGQLTVKPEREHSFAAALSYLHPAGEYTGLRLSYLNEGHPKDHHRDGIAAQAWLRSKPDARGLSFGLGAGKDYYFDTARTSSGDYHNDHGWANIYTLAATWHSHDRWYGKLEATRVFPRGKDTTTSIMAGVGYLFDGVDGNKLHRNSKAAEKSGTMPDGQTTVNATRPGMTNETTLTLSGGQTIVNSFDSQRSRSGSLEYRRPIAPYLDWTATFLKEGTSALTRRGGVATQVWLIRSLTEHVEMGVGVGPYLAIDLHAVPVRQSHLAGLVSIALRYHFENQWSGQVTWHRVVTDYHRDADMLQFGLGHSF